MKRIIAYFVLISCIFTMFVNNVSASDNVVSVKRVDMDDGSYVIETVYEEPQLTRDRSRTGSKKSVYYSSSNVALFSVTVNGTFTYNGVSSIALFSSVSMSLLNSDVYYNSKYATTSGATAVATGSVTYHSNILSLYVALTCSPDGTLS